MSQTTTENWRDRLKEMGKAQFELAEMKEMGFLDLTDSEFKALQEGLTEARKLRQEIGKINKELEGLDDVETVIKHIRKLRIERVRKKREARKIEKAKEKEVKQAAEQKRRQNTPPYLGKGVSKGLIYTGGDEELLKSLGLPPVHNVEQLALVMGLTTKQISWLSYHRITAQTDHYHRFKIPKQKGGFRNISSPKPTLRQAQSWILRNILEVIGVHEKAMAFRKNRSIKDNATLHEGKGVVMRIDLKDFFPSIQFRRVKGLFKSFGYNEGIATIFALMCTDAARMEAALDGQKYYVALGERYLPQGACTSPALTNIICRSLDRRMEALCQKFEFTYSRYADDMIFSHEDKSTDVAPVLHTSKKIIREEGFVFHPDKLAILRPHQRQAITGIVVNEKCTVSRKDMRKFRSFLHHYEQEGAEVMSERMGKSATQYAKGYWAFINMVDVEKAQKLLIKHPWLHA